MIKISEHTLVEQYNKYASYESKRWQDLAAQNVNSWADVWEQSVAHLSHRPIVHEVGFISPWSYQELDRAADKIAEWAISSNQKYIGVHQNNSAVFLATVLGLAKAGIVAVLFNARESDKKLSTLAHNSGVKITIGQPIPSVETYDPNWILERSWSGRTSAKHRRQVTLDDPVVIIFTSGTSGRSKPALFSHRRMIGAGIAWSLRTGMSYDSKCYITLPLYHGNGLAVAFSSCLEAGACAVVRDKFSVGAFLTDVRTYNCDSVVYIGELWRYLSNSPQQPEDAKNPLGVIFGNGLTSPLWEQVIERFGIEKVVEHYGATEMPASALTNWTGRPGYCGFIPPDHPDANNVALVNEQGKVVAPGEVGEAVLRVPGNFYRGYLDPKLDEDKLWRNLFEPGDLWWRSGDLLCRDADGFFMFVDRMGDSFRWKGENVSCVEVEEAILSTGKVREAVVYGVPIPGASGKVGMASILPIESLDEGETLDDFLTHLQELLSPYAIPHIIRLVDRHHETTSTMKIIKAHLQTEGFKQIEKYPHFALRQGRYVRLKRDCISVL
ncbi:MULTISPECIES: AMP-binding protein [unclassified Moorena]|uniref:AMP-binding protein n=1 Tax=unclassified Moorena TaxID=2683338 RepID=UPI0013C96E8E|nr:MULTISPECIES: AMP-binding protein [unclassified Moorena]NEO19741.1 AMP-binding protein [Moorena sp. SIO4A5]NEP22519.1 AMP-binding protein [Moorena sp. SIO3I6]NEQ58771.1 AMP-binding protein [Moorena sp. SIO4A1]